MNICLYCNRMIYQFFTNPIVQIQMAYLLTLTNGIFFMSYFLQNKKYETDLQLQLKNQKLELLLNHKIDVMNQKISYLLKMQMKTAIATQTDVEIKMESESQTDLEIKENNDPIKMLESYFSVDENDNDDYNHIVKPESNNNFNSNSNSTSNFNLGLLSNVWRYY